MFQNIQIYLKKFYQLKNHFYAVTESSISNTWSQDLRTSRYRAFVDETRRRIIHKGWEEYVYVYV